MPQKIVTARQALIRSVIALGISILIVLAIILLVHDLPAWAVGGLVGIMGGSQIGIWVVYSPQTGLSI